MHQIIGRIKGQRCPTRIFEQGLHAQERDIHDICKHLRELSLAHESSKAWIHKHSRANNHPHRLKLLSRGIYLETTMRLT